MIRKTKDSGFGEKCNAPTEAASEACVNTVNGYVSNKRIALRRHLAFISEP